MEGILDLLPSVLNRKSVNHLQNYLSSCEEHVAFHGGDKKNEGYVKLVNIRLNENENRLEGLLILNIALQQCSVEAFVDNASSWMSHCLKGTFDKHSIVANVSFNVLGILLKMAVKFPEIKKQASSTIVPNALEHSKRDIDSETLQSLLECLIVCMREYPGPCGEYNKFILNLLLRLLDAEPSLLSVAAKCYALLSQVKGKSKEGISYKNVWKTNQLVLIHTLHHYLDLLFDNVDEIQTTHRPSEGNIELLVTKPIDKKASASERMQQIMKHIRGMSKYLQAMLLGGCPFPKTVLPDVILGLICRGLAVTCLSLGNVTNDSLALGSVLPDVHTDLLNILIALITCCGRNLIQYGSVICKLINQELKWTSTHDWPHALDKPYRILRSTVYNCLHCWLSSARAASSIETTVEEIVKYILQDVHIHKPTVTLKATGSSGKKHQPHYNFLSDSRGDKIGLQLANKELCLSALKCLQRVLYSSTAFIKSAICKVIQESVITLLFEVQNTYDGPPIPYSDISCRKELYCTLQALCMEPHSTFSPPLNYAIAIFKGGLVDTSSEISVVCCTALSSIEKIIHPSAPPLDGPLRYDAIQTNESEITSGTVLLNNNTNQSINDIPLSAFPNLNNIVVVKVIQNYKNDNSNENNGRVSDHECSNSDMKSNFTNRTVDKDKFLTNKFVKSIQKTTINLNGGNALNKDCSLGDIISLNNSFSDEVIVNGNCNDSYCNNEEDKKEAVDDNDDKNNEDIAEIEDSDEKSKHDENSVPENIDNPTENKSLFTIINKTDDNINEANITCLAELKENENEVQKINSENEVAVIKDINIKLESDKINMNNLEEPPLKRIKVLENGIDNEDHVKTDTSIISNGLESTDVNGTKESILHDEDEMISCFVDEVAE
ncbi:proline-, glutamic acid- and leucine-rich protein 1-like [Lycorma delicatula]|uniref:proline-, glutamic acid- and leucine-rich protein 1-like n=1 Tax=Lycorma delicatula TaxID=130591 RepID=UPI003F50E139